MAADPRVCLHDILNAIAGAREAIGAADFPTYRRRRPIRRAVERESRSSPKRAGASPRRRLTESGIPWHKIAGIGDVLRHDYEIVSDPVIWNAVHDHLPALEAALRILARLDTDER